MKVTINQLIKLFI